MNGQHERASVAGEIAQHLRYVAGLAKVESIVDPRFVGYAMGHAPQFFSDLKPLPPELKLN